MNQWKYKKNNQNDITSYFNGLRSFITNIMEDVESLEDYSKRLNEITTDPRFDKLANEAARRIITFQAESNARTWREAARRSSKGYRIYKGLLADLKRTDQFANLIAQSAYQIKTLPLSISQRVVKKAATLATEGKRPLSVAEEIRKYFPEATKASAQLIARTQVAKTYAAITETRASNMGIKAYVWHTVGGPKVRDSHRHMNDVIVLYSDPPAPEELVKKKSAGHYHAGEIYNCRCYQEPILDFGDITWPHKVYFRGKIKKIGLKSFTDLLK